MFGLLNIIRLSWKSACIFIDDNLAKLKDKINIYEKRLLYLPLDHFQSTLCNKYTGNTEKANNQEGKFDCKFWPIFE